MIFKSFSMFSTIQMCSQACICKKTRAYFCKNVGSQCLSKLTNINNFFRRYSIIIFLVKFVVATEHTHSTTPTPSTNGYSPTPSNEWTSTPPPPPKSVSPGSGSVGARSQLLGSISSFNKGALKKATTLDKSLPKV